MDAQLHILIEHHNPIQSQYNRIQHLYLEDQLFFNLILPQNILIRKLVSIN